MQWGKRSPAGIEDLSSALSAVAWESNCTKAEGSWEQQEQQCTSSSVIPCFPHCSKESCTWLIVSHTSAPWKEPHSFFVGCTRSVANKQLPITKGRSNDPGVLMRESHDKAVDSHEPRKHSLSIFTWNRCSCCHDNVRRSNAGSEPTLLWSEIWDILIREMEEAHE